MNSYWNSVPRGVWTVIDTSDALEAIRDLESTYTFNESQNRLYVYGPNKKAIIIELNKIREIMGFSDYSAFINDLNDATKLRVV